MRTSMDRLFEAAEARGPVCVGLDTSLDCLPEAARSSAGSPARGILAYNRALIDACGELVACFKVQIAYYEALGLEGLATYAATLAYARARGVLVIADIKRGDIADTAARYAEAHFSGDFEADFVTLNPYMGMDTLEPWTTLATAKGKGAFVLVRTSNPGRQDFEALKTETGERLYHRVGDSLSALAERVKGDSGYGTFGAVLGCTEREEAAALRERWPQLFFLVPGYGAQGGAASDAALLLRNGSGGVVNASRSILKAWRKLPEPGACDVGQAAEAASAAVISMRDALRAAGAGVLA